MSTIDDTTQADAELAVTRVFLDRLLATAKAARAYGTEHPNYHRMIEGVVEAIAAASPPFAVRFIGAATFRDRTLMPLDADGFVRCAALARGLGNLGVQEVRFQQTPDAEELGRFVEVLADGLQAPSDRLAGLSLSCISCREIAGARFGNEAERVDPTVFGRAQIVLAITESAQLLGDAPWSWPGGVAVVRRLERAWTTCPDVPGWVLEDQADWSVSARAVSAAWHTWDAARAVGVAAANARAAAHAALAVTLHGLSAAGAVSTAEAALRAHGRMSAAPLMSAGGAEPHRVRTSTLVYCLTRPEGLPKHPLLPLIATNYVLEVRRVPPRGAPLRWPELLSWAAPHAGRWISAPWLAVLTEMEAPAPS